MCVQNFWALDGLLPVQQNYHAYHVSTLGNETASDRAWHNMKKQHCSFTNIISDVTTCTSETFNSESVPASLPSHIDKDLP